MYGSWEYLLAEFRKLGGIADNVSQMEGEFGRGIFPLNPNLRSRIFVPSKLMVKSEDVFLKDNRIRIKERKGYKKEIRDFFNLYQDNFSWGKGGKEETESFEKGLSLFNSNLKELIKIHALVDLEKRHKGNWDEVILKQFLESRLITFNNEAMIAPMFDLVNHEITSLPFIINSEGISTPNYPPTNKELRHSYNCSSPLSQFFAFGFFSKETIIFSVPFTINIKKGGIKLNCKGKNFRDDLMTIQRDANTITIEGLPIADANNPELPKIYFDELLRKIEDINLTKEFLLKIFKLNIECRKNIINELATNDHKVFKMLTKVLHYEIDLISYNN